MLAALGLAAAAGAASAAPPTVSAVATSQGVVSYQKSFPVKSCKPAGAKGVTLSADDGDYALTVNAAKLPGTLWIRGGDDDGAIELRGKVTSVSTTGAPGKRKITAKGVLTAGRTGKFTVTGDCR